MPRGGRRTGPPRLAKCGHRAPFSPGPPRKFCADCKPVPGDCENCGERLGRRGKKFCSRRCKDIFHGNRRAEPLPQMSCEWCGEEFQPIHRKQRCCCEQHGKNLYNRESRADGRQKPDPWNDRRRDNYQKRRALKKNAETVRPVIREEIARRDGFLCGICGEPVDMSIPWPEPQSPSIDHVIPLTRGGEHDPDNCQLAHLVCNTRKGNRAEQTAA